MEEGNDIIICDEWEYTFDTVYDFVEHVGEVHSLPFLWLNIHLQGKSIRTSGYKTCY